MIEEPMVWANQTQHQSVIFADNDYEVFISPDGSNHYYKEYEMNAKGVWWDLCLNKPYSDGGYENSTRVFNTSSNPGWDDPGLRTATKVFGCDVNIPPGGNKTCRGWSLEIAFPLAAISLNNTNALPIKHGSYWRINFSRVEWKAHIEGGAASGGLASGGDASSRYVLGEKAGDGSCDWPCPGGCKQNPGDNWLWAPLGIVDVHQPERWGYLQFATGAVNATAVRTDPDFSLRAVAMQLYYAQKAWASSPTLGNGSYTEDVQRLVTLAPLGAMALNGTCSGVPTVELTRNGKGYVGTIIHLSTEGFWRAATITDDRYLLVRDGASQSQH